MTAQHILDGAVLPAIFCVAGGIVIWFLTRLISPAGSRQVIRLDSVVYTTVGGAVIGCLVMCADYHTVSHGPAAAFVAAGIISAGASFGAGVVGRLIGVIIGDKSEQQSLTRWIGNILAFVSPALVVPTLALL